MNSKHWQKWEEVSRFWYPGYMQWKDDLRREKKLLKLPTLLEVIWICENGCCWEPRVHEKISEQVR